MSKDKSSNLTPEAIDAVREYVAEKVGAWTLLELDDSSIRRVVEEEFQKRSSEAHARLAAEARKHVEREVNRISGGLNVDAKDISAKWREETAARVIGDLANEDFSGFVSDVAAAVVAKKVAAAREAITAEANRIADEQVAHYRAELNEAYSAALKDAVLNGCKPIADMRAEAERLLAEKLESRNLACGIELRPGEVLVKPGKYNFGEMMRRIGLAFESSKRNEDEVRRIVAFSSPKGYEIYKATLKAEKEAESQNIVICEPGLILLAACFSNRQYTKKAEIEEIMEKAGYHAAGWLETLLFLDRVGLDNELWRRKDFLRTISERSRCLTIDFRSGRVGEMYIALDVSKECVYDHDVVFAFVRDLPAFEVVPFG